MHIKSFAEANTLLSRYWPTVLSRPAYALEHIVQLMEFLGNPQEKLKIIHIAGTSGKTSTAYYAAALLHAAGQKVGLTVSPHVDEVNERVQLNMVPMPEATFCHELGIFMDLIAKSDVEPSYFELLTALAYWEFVRQGMEYAVMEVGLGGLYDATNVIQREDKVCMITDIGLDHMRVLGNTVGKIAGQKAGIIQLHNSVFCYRQADPIMRRIRARAKQKQADLHILEATAAEWQLPALPLFQQRNLGLAHAAVDWALSQHKHSPLTDDMVRQAATTYIPGRMETFTRQGKTIVMDGAHNAQKLQALGASLQRKYGDQPMAGVVSFVAGREDRLDDAVAEIAPRLQHVIVTGFGGGQDTAHQSLDGQEIAEAFMRHGMTSIEVIADPAAAIDALYKRPEPLLLVTGSFYLLGHIRPLLRP